MASALGFTRLRAGLTRWGAFPLGNITSKWPVPAQGARRTVSNKGARERVPIEIEAASDYKGIRMFMLTWRVV